LRLGFPEMALLCSATLFLFSHNVAGVLFFMTSIFSAIVQGAVLMDYNGTKES